MSLQHMGKGALRVAKNYTKGYSDVQAKVRDATSNDPWGPSGTQMNEIAQLTYNQNDFVEIMEMLDKRLNDKGKNWRHVFKALTLLDYCLHAGSENVVIYFRDNVYLVKTLKEFQYIDEYSKDQGANVRQKAKDITNLLQDESRLRQERRSRANMRDRMIRGGPGGEDIPEDENTQRRSRSTPGGSRRNRDREDDDFQKALEASKRSAEQEAQKSALSAEERDLQRAIKLSEEEEANRAKAVEEANSKSLFEDGSAQTATTVNTNPFPLVDASAQSSLQPQFTIQPQITSFNPYLQQQQEAQQMAWAQQQQQQQQQQEAQQLAWAQQQQEWQQQEWLRQQAELQAQAQVQAQAQAQNDWAMQQMQLQQLQQMQAQQQALQQQQQQQTAWLQVQQASPLTAQPTGFGSKNPFASSSPASAVPPVPQLPMPAPSLSQAPAPSRSAPPTTSVPTVKVGDNPENEALAALFANREGGTDTFGNVGNLRYGHTPAARAFTATQTGAAQQPAHSDQPFFSV